MRLVLLSLAALVVTAKAGVIVYPDEEISIIPLKEKTSETCAVCNLLIDGINAQIKANHSDVQILKYCNQLCDGIPGDSGVTCRNWVKGFADEIFYVFRRHDFVSGEFCNAFVPDCGNLPTPLQRSWNITIPGNKPPVKPWPTVQAGKPKLHVLHLSDLHIDRKYAAGSEAQCRKAASLTSSLCCRNSDTVTRKDRDIKAIVQPAGPWGSADICDIPYATFDNAMQHISTSDKFDYIIITGDFEAHDCYDYTRELTEQNIQNVTATLLKYFPTTPIYVSIGNHEGVPQDAMMPHSMEEYDVRGPAWLYDSLADSWKNWLPQDTIAGIKYRASYAVYPKPGLKLISINTVYCSKNNYYLYINQSDPDGTLAWLIQELSESENKGEKVHIISHIPSGSDYCLMGWAHNFYDIVNRYENTIAAQFYGHTHQDHFQVFYEDADPRKRPTHFNFIAPSLTTFEWNNPGYRVYDIDGVHADSTYTVIDAYTYYADVADAAAKGSQPQWRLEYNTREEYGMKDLSPSSFDDLVNRMENDQALFTKFHSNYYRQSGHGAGCPKQPACVKKMTCAMKSARSHDEAHFCAIAGQ